MLINQKKAKAYIQRIKGLSPADFTNEVIRAIRSWVYQRNKESQFYCEILYEECRLRGQTRIYVDTLKQIQNSKLPSEFTGGQQSKEETQVDT